MNQRFGTILAMSLLASTAAGTAQATDETADVRHYLQHEGSLNTWPSINVSVDHEGVATVTGHVESELDRRRVARIVADAPGVEKVVNLVQPD